MDPNFIDYDYKPPPTPSESDYSSSNCSSSENDFKGRKTNKQNKSLLIKITTQQETLHEEIAFLRKAIILFIGLNSIFVLWFIVCNFMKI